MEPAPLPVKTEGRYERIAGNEPAGSKRIRDESKTNTEDECAVDRLQSLRNANDVNQYSLQMCSTHDCFGPPRSYTAKSTDPGKWGIARRDWISLFQCRIPAR